MVSLINRSLIAASLALTFLSGCSMSKETSDTALTWGAGGTVVGAGTGAAIGAAIANGDIATSTLLGAGVGLPVGIAAGLIYHSYRDDRLIEANEKLIKSNQKELGRAQTEIEAYREELFKDSASIEVDESMREYRFEGASLGNYYR